MHFGGYLFGVGLNDTLVTSLFHAIFALLDSYDGCTISGATSDLCGQYKNDPWLSGLTKIPNTDTDINVAVRSNPSKALRAWAWA